VRPETSQGKSVAQCEQETDSMNKTIEMDEFDTTQHEARVYAVLHARKGRWTTFETVAIKSGLSLADATSALSRMKDQKVLDWKWRELEGVFRLPSKSASARRAELECEARRLRLIPGPWMKPLFGFSK